MKLPTLLPLLILSIFSLVPALTAHPQTQVQAQRAQQWIMPASFTFNSTADFFWPVVGGVNLLGMFVRNVKAPDRNLGGLPLGPCAIPNVQQNTCSQYVNNGTAQFGGIYAGGLTPGQKYFIAVVWIAADSSSSGTSSSPSFTMQFPDDPYPPNAVGAPNRNSGLPSTVSTVFTTTVQLAILQTTLSTVTSSATPTNTSSPKTGMDLTSAASNSTSGTHPPTTKRSSTKIPPWAIAVTILGCIAFILLVACVICKTLSHLKARRTEAEKQKYLAIARENALAQSQPAELRGGDLSELPGYAWDGAHELPGSRGGSEMEGDEIMMRKTLPKSTSGSSVGTSDTVVGTDSSVSEDSRLGDTGGKSGGVFEMEASAQMKSKEEKQADAEQTDSSDSNSAENKSTVEEEKSKPTIVSVAKGILARARSY